MIVTSCQKRIMITRNQLTVVMWAPCPGSHPTMKECNVIMKCIAIVLGHFVNRTVLHLTRCIEMINHIHSCQIIAANGVVMRVWISVPPCFPSHRALRQTVPIDCFTICRETTQATSVFIIMRETSWDVEQTRIRLPFLAKTTVQA